jgi:hypothetical protein
MGREWLSAWQRRCQYHRPIINPLFFEGSPKVIVVTA